VAEPRRVVAVFSGGGTGGHLYPALALAEAVGRLRPDVHPFFVGAERGIEARLLPARGVEHLLLPVKGADRRSLLANLGVIKALLASVAAVRRVFRTLRPGMVVVTGGYAGGPAGIAAGLLGIPLALQEQNAVPGATTRMLSRWARQVHVAFPEAVDLLPRSARGRAVVAGNPVRPPVPMDPAAARRGLGLEEGGVVVLVTGGSQGSAALNTLVLEALRGVAAGRLVRPHGMQLLWSTGPSHIDGIRTALAGLGSPAWVRAVGYLDDMPSVLAGSDLAVSRAGAMATSEFTAWGIPAVLVPLPTAAADHQTRNARALAEAGAVVHLVQAGLEPDTLWAAMAGIVTDDARRDAMARAARGRGHPEAALQIARALVELLPPARPVEVSR
jgi:UDP-N-acetylglucosamine--N-acetylmuramyl-(pentapeptide) pyrophosphoryl-undecaprenol N-acetylglucosamine transferase